MGRNTRDHERARRHGRCAQGGRESGETRDAGQAIIDTARVALAEGKIEEIRQAQQAQERAKRAQEITGLSEQQIAGLRAVEAGAAEALDMVNAFTLDVLGRMHLLARVKGKKGKSAWVLTEDGRAALKTHEIRRTAGEDQE